MPIVNQSQENARYTILILRKAEKSREKQRKSEKSREKQRKAEKSREKPRRTEKI